MDRRARIVLQADVSFKPPFPGELIHRVPIEHDGEMLADHGDFHFVPTRHSLWKGSGGLKTPDCAGRIAALSTSVDLDFVTLVDGDLRIVTQLGKAHKETRV